MTEIANEYAATDLESSEDETVDDAATSDDEELYDAAETTLAHFGADFDVRGLVDRLKDGDIIVPRFDPDETAGSTLEGFQRKRVWSKPRMEQFVETLLLGWPVPSIFLVLDKDQRYLVLDGQQRLTTLRSFYDGKHPDGNRFELKEVSTHLKGAHIENLSPELRRRLNNTFIQATVIEPKGDEGARSVYRLFGRLNSGGVMLTPQEIRVALFRGDTVDWIRKLNNNPYWREIYGAKNSRLKDHELVLRSVVMSGIVSQMLGRWDDEEIRRGAYTPPMAEELNRYLDEDIKYESRCSPEVEKAFNDATNLLNQAKGRDSLRLNGRLNAAHIDAVLGTLIVHLKDGDEYIPHQINNWLDGLQEDDEYLGWVSKSTSHRESVFGRLQRAYQTLMPNV